MATVHSFTGFEAGQLKDGSGYLYESLSVVTGDVAIESSVVRSGNYAAKLFPGADAGVDHFDIGIPSGTGDETGNTGSADCYCSFALRVTTRPTADDEQIFMFYNSGTDGHHLRIDSDGHLNLYDSADSLLASGTTALDTGTQYEIKISQVNSDSSYELLINDVSEFSGSESSPAGYLSLVRFGRTVSKNDEAYVAYIDDVAITTGGFVDSPFQVEAVVPTGAGHYSDGTGDYQDVDELPLGLGGSDDFITIAITELHSLVCATPSVTGAVAAVKVSCMAKRSLGGDEGKVFLRSGTTDLKVASAAPILTAYNCFEKIANTDPNTSGAWTAAAIASVEIGFECTSGATTGVKWGNGQEHILFAGTIATATRRMIAYNFGG